MRTTTIPPGAGWPPSLLVHLVVSFVHGIAHGDANVRLTLAASLFVVIVVVLALQ
jgi:hypothetical protein